MVTNRRANSLDVSTSRQEWEEADSIVSSVAVPGTTVRGKIADKRSQGERDAYGLIGTLVHDFIHGFGIIHHFVAYPGIDFFAAFHCRGKALAGFIDFLSNHVGDAGQQVAGASASVLTGLLTHSARFVYVIFFRLDRQGAIRHLPNILATKKMTMAPKRPPPPRRYMRE
jgi:hypothetical protein